MQMEVDVNVNETAAKTDDRRRDNRLALRMPVELRLAGSDGPPVVRTITRNVSSGGVFAQTDVGTFRPGDQIDVDLTIHASEGVSSSQGRARCRAEVVRVQAIRTGDGDAEGRFGVAARFLEPLKFTY